MTSSSTQSAYTIFHNEFTNLYNITFPVKTIKIGYKNRKPWLSPNLKKCIKKKNNLYKKLKLRYSLEKELYYKNYRNRLNSLLFLAERDHYETLIKENHSNIKKSWKILKDVINKKKKSVTNSRFMINNNIVTDKKLIAEGFNSFFINIGPTLAEKIPETDKSHTHFLRHGNVHNIILQPVAEKEVKKSLRT